MSEKQVRVRFAPSPTGIFHLGNIRTALYNYLLAKKYNGQFILRIEDTDRSRFVPKAEEYIINSLKWLNIMPDEGIINGGDYGPYRQSERKDLYLKYAQQLIDSGYAYYAFDSHEELEEMHKKMENVKITSPQYNAISREWMKNSLTLSEAEVKSRIDNGEEYVIRFKCPKSGTVRFHDKIRGWIQIDVSTLDDKVLIKSDGMATYHLAALVDDYLMKISHVIRGEEWLPSAPLHVLMYQAFGWEKDMPEFVHLPLLLKPSGQGKLSKRDADELGFPIYVRSWDDEVNNKHIKGYDELGYLPDAVINFVALMGWSPGNNQELFTREELINAFSLDHISKSGARFNIKKAIWFNHQFIIREPIENITNIIKNKLKDENIICNDDNKILKIGQLVQERSNYLTDIWMHSKVFFIAPTTYEDYLQYCSSVSIDIIKEFIKDMNIIDYNILHDNFSKLLEQNNLKLQDVMPAMRIALFGVHSGPDVMKSILILGKDETIERFNKFFRSLYN